MQLRQLLVVLLILTPGLALAGTNDKARVTLHITGTTAKGTACNSPNFPSIPCNDGESNFNIHESNLGHPYWVYVIVADASPIPEFALAGLQFGISYSTNLGATWVLCSGDFYVESDVPDWPASGSGISITWSAPSNCQGAPTPGDLQGDANIVVGAFSVSPYADDVMRITKNETIQLPRFAIADCEGRSQDLEMPQAAGSVSFGSLPSGFDPCKGPFVPFSEFQNLSTSELDALQIKVTPLTSAGRVHIYKGAVAQISPFLYHNYHRLGEFTYYDSFDSTGSNALLTPPSEMQAALDVIASLPDVSDGGVDEYGSVSLGIFYEYLGETKVFESILDHANASDLLAGWHSAFQGSATLRDDVDDLACSANLLLPSSPVDISSSTSVSVGGFRLNHSTQQFVGTVKVKNTSGTQFPGPVYLILNEGRYVGITNSDGRTCREVGPSYFVLDVGGSFDPGEEVEVIVEIDEFARSKMTLDPKVYAGEGII